MNGPTSDTATLDRVRLRPPEVVMRLSRMGQSFPTRLSFLRILIRNLAAEGRPLSRPVWDIDADGYGTAVYTAHLGGRPYSLVAVASPLDDAARSDRVIATAWDAAFVLYDGVPDATERARIAQAAPLQEAGRFSERDLVLSRANKSMRLWNHVVSALRAGQQPDLGEVARVGYLMRTTAVYGNGKFGIADRHLIADRAGLKGPFAAEMLTVWLIRQFTLDLVEHVGGAMLGRAIKRGLGVGNATGLGMAPFLVSHPVLLHNWVLARETALARVRALPDLGADDRDRLQMLSQRALRHLENWHVDDPDSNAQLRALEAAFARWRGVITEAQSTEALYTAADTGSEALQELVVALLLEAFPDAVDTLDDRLDAPVATIPCLTGSTEDLRAGIARDWSWAVADYSRPSACQRFWYVSADKLEPRIGDRFADDGADCERPLDVARRVAALAADLPETPRSIRAFLEDFPHHLYAVERVAVRAQHLYAEINDNLIAASCRPIDMLRAKLAFFGATGFDPKSDLWTRVTLAQGAPLGDEVHLEEADDWWLSETVQ